MHPESGLAIVSIAQAGFPPRTTCSNEGGHITIADSQVTIQSYKHPSLITEKFAESELNIQMEVVQEMADQISGCSRRKVVFKNVTLSKKDGSPLPNAYNVNTIDGALNDYMICSTTYVWLPAQGESCLK